MSKLIPILFLSAVTAFPQATRTANMVGSVTDPSGSLVAGAKVIVVNTETKFTFEATTSATGDYYVPYLPIGAYEMSVEAPGFKKYIQSGIVLRVGESPRIDVRLDVGTVAESVTVTGRHAAARNRNFNGRRHVRQQGVHPHARAADENLQHPHLPAWPQ